MCVCKWGRSNIVQKKILWVCKYRIHYNARTKANFTVIHKTMGKPPEVTPSAACWNLRSLIVAHAGSLLLDTNYHLCGIYDYLPGDRRDSSLGWTRSGGSHAPILRTSVFRSSSTVLPHTRVWYALFSFSKSFLDALQGEHTVDSGQIVKTTIGGQQ